MMNEYEKFLSSKQHEISNHGFEPVFIPDMLFEFQKACVEWACVKGRAALFEDCGLGKTFQQLVWAENIVRKTNGRVLIVTPLAVSHQTKKEAEKIGVDAVVRREGIKTGDKIVITNYERLHYFDHNDFEGVVCDESSILKNFKGETKAAITDFMRKKPYRLLCTATAAPNDYIELGTSSEALGELGYIDMLKKFFKSNDNSYAQGGSGSKGGKRFNKNPFGGKFRFRGHAERDFWRWVCSWARALRQPSDLGYSNDDFKLKDLIVRDHVVTARRKRSGYLFDIPAVGLAEQREDLRRSINERCEMAAEIVTAKKGQSLCWCNLNDEGKLLKQMIPNAVEIAGSDTDERKEEVFIGFANGDIETLITKPKIAGFGMNWQNCNAMTFFPSHSYEQYYQCVRRCWRFGQKNNVTVDMITTDGQADVLKNLLRKSDAAEKMFDNLVTLMWNELKIKNTNEYTRKEELPSWL